jgi:hypothetical protein
MPAFVHFHPWRAAVRVRVFSVFRGSNDAGQMLEEACTSGVLGGRNMLWTYDSNLSVHRSVDARGTLLTETMSTIVTILNDVDRLNEGGTLLGTTNSGVMEFVDIRGGSIGWGW